MHTILTIILQASPEAAPNSWLTFLPFILMILVIYFLLWRPNAKRQKEHQNMLGGVAQGDEVVTIGGIHAKVAGVRDQDKTLILKISTDIKITVDRSAVARVVKKADGSDAGE